MKNKQMQGHLCGLLTILIWGTTFISTKVLLTELSPLQILFIRFVIGYAALWLFHPHVVHVKDHRQELWFMAAGLCGITLYYLLENIALTDTDATNVGVIISVAPFFTALFSKYFLHEKPGGRFFYLGFTLAMAGILLISIPYGSLSFHPFGDVLALLAAIVWAIYSLLCRKIAHFPLNSLTATRRTFFYGLLLMLPVLLTQESTLLPSIDWNLVIVGNLIFLGLGASALCFVTWNIAVRILGSLQTSVYIYLVPVIATITSFLILHEQIDMQKLAGILLTISGLFLSQDNRKKQAACNDHTQIHIREEREAEG